MLSGLLKVLYPMGIVGDEDNGGTETVDPPADGATDEGGAPTPPAENEDEKPEISDDQFATLKDVLSPEQFESINQTRAMNKRMREKMAKLEKDRATVQQPTKPETKEEKPNSNDSKDFNPIEWVSDTDKGKAAIAQLQRSGLDNDQIGAIIDLMGITGTRITKWGIDPIASEFREGKFTKALDKFSTDDKYKFVMSKPDIRKAVESYIRNNFQPEEWNDEKKIKEAYGITVTEHPEIFAQSKREIIEDGGIHEKGEGNLVSTDNVSAIAAFARKHGMDFDTKENRSIAKNAYTAWKSTTKET